MMRSEVVEVGRLVNLWNEWALQILVLVSFGLQVFLLVFGGVRRHSNSTALMFFLWSAYLLADSTAIYTLGHLSVDNRSNEHQLVAFWAPFLLLHLGGPDNITAYALEDNALWLRHLQTLAVQVLGAAYVIYEYISSSGALLLLASLSMFVAGLLKYGERIWALKCGNISSIRSSISIRKVKTDPYQLLTLGTSEEDLLLGAHSQFDICKGVFADIIMLPNPSVRSQPKPRSVISYLGEDLYKLVEMELSLMYDFLYTKAAVIHTCSVSTTVEIGTAKWMWLSVMFYWLGLWSWKSYQCAGLYCPPGHVLCCTAGAGDGSGLSTLSLPLVSVSIQQDIKKLVLQALRSKEQALQHQDTDLNSRGSFILKRMEAYKDFARWSVNIDFDESILVWHIATEVYIRKSKAKHAKELLEATEVLSNYLMFLLVVKPNMLPGAARHNIHLTSCEQLEGQCRMRFGDKDNPVAPSPVSWNPYYILKDLFHHDGPSCSRIPRREKLAEVAWSFSQFALGSVRAPNPHGDSIRDNANMYAILLANELLSIELQWQDQRDTLELILGVWVEMSLYAADHCSQESHARQLSNGCEFITIVSLLAHHFKYYSGVFRGTDSLGEDKPASENNPVTENNHNFHLMASLSVQGKTNRGFITSKKSKYSYL